MRREIVELRGEIRSLRDMVMKGVGILAALVVLANIFAPYLQKFFGGA